MGNRKQMGNVDMKDMEGFIMLGDGESWTDASSVKDFTLAVIPQQVWNMFKGYEYLPERMLSGDFGDVEQIGEVVVPIYGIKQWDMEALKSFAE